MERLPTPLTRLAGGLLCVLGVFSAGCLTPRKAAPTAVPPANTPAASTSAKSSIWPVSFQEITNLVAPASSGPQAVEIVCMWQNRVAYLPDPSKNGAMAPGLAGQMFLFGPGSSNAPANGTLTVDLYDESQAHTGTAPTLAERWVFDPETLKKLASHDETFGRSYTLFLPWPSYKPSTNQVRLMVKYEPGQGHALFAPAAPLTLDAKNTGLSAWSGGSTNAPRSPAPGAFPNDAPSVPVDPSPLGGPPPSYPVTPPGSSAYPTIPQPVSPAPPAVNEPVSSTGILPPSPPPGLPPLAIVSGQR